MEDNRSIIDNGKQQIKSTVKKHLPKDWLCEIRIAYRIIMEAVNDVKRTGMNNFVIITTMSAILILFGVLFRFTLSLSTFAHDLGNHLEISVYLKSDAKPSIVKNRIKEIKHVKDIHLITKEQSWSDFKRDLSFPDDMPNPLPDTLRVRVDKPDSISEVFNNIKPIAGVEDVNYAEDLGKKMQTFSHIANISVALVIFIAALLTITIINNTIQLVIQSRKEEIEIMRLMGVSNWYIKTPLVMQGAGYGLVSAFIAVLPLSCVQGLLKNVHSFFSIPVPPYAQNIVVISLLIIGIAFGASGSLLSIKKHLQV